MKTLITSGCSFSDPRLNTWSKQLENLLPSYEHVQLGRMSQGNGIISRKLIHKVTELLKTKNSDDLIAGIMWSGTDRYDFYKSDYPKNFKNNLSHIENPTGFVNHNNNWVIFNPHWDTPNCSIYYKLFHDPIYFQILTLEHILRTQWFLEKHKIKYFMTTYTNEVCSDHLITNNEVDYLYNQINFNNFLPVTGEYEWCAEHMPNSFPMINDKHPGHEQHAAFAEKVILPFLKEKQYI
jgi:hypothetical protein